jgi:beta-N-acetylhexosaminidase
MPSTPQHIAGQSMMLRFPGPTFTDEARAAFHRILPGGVLFFADNITSRSQIHDLCAELQAEAQSLGLPPLLIALDQEGGLVSRLTADPDFVTPPAAMALSAANSVDLIREAARMTGEQLAEVGINVDFAPVVDVNNNHANPVIRTRSFGDTVETVIAGGLASIAGLEEAGIAATVKHFPGHGDTHVDSHLGLPVIGHDLNRLRAVELAPFQAAIDAGVPGVMTTHIVFLVLDEYPATLSRAILTDLLRGEMGFQGVIFTDSLSMDAIEDRYGHRDTAILAKQAGVDMLEANESLKTQVERHQALVDAIEDGSLARDLFTQTIERLNRLRQRFHLTHTVPALKPSDPARHDRALEIARRTIVAQGDSPFAALAHDATGLIVDFQRFRSSEAEDPVHRGRILRELVSGQLPSMTIATLEHEPSAGAIERAIESGREVDVIVFLTRDATDNPIQIDVARRIIDAAPNSARIIHVALRGPYDLGLVPQASSRIATYGDPAVTIHALVDILTGASPITGVSPISV